MSNAVISRLRPAFLKAPDATATCQEVIVDNTNVKKAFSNGKKVAV